MPTRHEVRLCGFGGQGIVLAGYIIGQAATVHEGLNAVFTQDYGPEARGGACRADIIISDRPVLYPYIETPTVLVAMSQAAFEKYFPGASDSTTVIIDEDLVSPPGAATGRVVRMPARRIAEELGRVAVANVAMLGYLTAVTGIVSAEAMQRSILSSVPKGTEELNTTAFKRGLAAAGG